MKRGICLDQPTEMWGGSQPVKTGAPTPAHSGGDESGGSRKFRQQPEVLGRNCGPGLQTAASPLLPGK